MNGRAPSIEAARTADSYRAALTSSLINALGMPLDLWIGRRAHVPPGPLLACAAIGVVGTAVLMARRGKASITLSSAVFIANALAVSSALAMVSPAFAASGDPWTPFQANKLGMMIVAALGPELVPGLIAIGALGLSALAQQELLIGQPSAVSEPIVMMIFLIIAVVLLVLRLRGAASVRALARARADAESAAEINRRLLALRDLANTPLQNLEVAARILETEYPAAKRVTDAMVRAIVRMRDLQPILRN
jgi:hypothetical protein